MRPSVFERNADDFLEANPSEIYDGWYYSFWKSEHGLERTGRDIERINECAVIGPGIRVLDLGCGFGRIANALAEVGCDVVGVDQSHMLLSIAEQDSAGRGLNVKYRRLDLTTESLDDLGKFDIVLLWSTCVGHWGELGDRRVVSKAIAALKPLGRLLIESRHWDGMQRGFESHSVRDNQDDLLIESHRYDALLGVQTTRQTIISDRQRMVREYRLRRYGAPELRRLCLDAGARLVDAIDETGEPLHERSERLIMVVAR